MKAFITILLLYFFPVDGAFAETRSIGTLAFEENLKIEIYADNNLELISASNKVIDDLIAYFHLY